MVTLHEELSTFMILSLWMRLRMRNISDKFGVKLEAHILYSVIFFENLAFYVVTWTILYSPVNHKWQTIWSIRIACWVPMSTNAYSEHIIVIAFPLQQWLQERSSVLCYKYIACFIYLFIKSYHSCLTMIHYDACK